MTSSRRRFTSIHPLRALARPSLLALAGGIAALAAAASDARAVVTEPDGEQVPKPLTMTEISTAASTNPLFPVVSLDALFAARSETVDWQADAQSKPDTFSPVCGFTAQLVLRGGGCAIDFGWYNVVPGHIPADAEIFPLITAAQIKALPLQAFEPGAGETLPGLSFAADSILADARYAGGLIGFATRGAQGTFCTQTHYSQQDLNLACSNCPTATDKHWISSIIYKSSVDQNGYYIAFEDLPMSTTSFAGDGQYKNDGDMNDFVFFVSGVTCPGGGKPCDTGMLGFCKQGVTQCQTGGKLICVPSFGPMPEKCDAIDNDCNGMVDDGNLCLAGQTCLHGKCVNPCGESEFPCPSGLTCKDGLCVDPVCGELTCPENQVCHAVLTAEGRVGACAGPCDGVTCPQGQVCHIGRCVDLCLNVTCPPDKVCRDGACVTKCQCLACDPGEACQDPTGKCVPQGCEAVTCPAGQVCSSGTCIDGCQGVVCPIGQSCKTGQCIDDPNAQTGPGGIINISTGSGGSSGGGSGKGGSGAVGTGGVTAPDGGAGGSSIERRTPPSCRCEVQPGDRGLSGLAFALALCASTLWRRRRR
jgi:hypothetical protein